jgi:hypothetical protein
LRAWVAAERGPRTSSFSEGAGLQPCDLRRDSAWRA